MQNKNITVCKGKIPDVKVKFYRSLGNSMVSKQQRMAKRKEMKVSAVRNNVARTIDIRSNTAKKQRMMNFTTPDSQETANSSMISSGSTSIPPIVTAAAAASSSTSASDRPMMQTRLTSNLRFDKEANNEAAVSTANAVHCCGLPFAIVDHPSFRHMLHSMRGVSPKFQMPGRKSVAGELSDRNYEQHMTALHDDLIKEAETHGLMIMGDGATVKRLPLLNMLASGVHRLGVLSIVDCTEHMAGGGVKDARFISTNVFEPVMKKIDPDFKYWDLCSFDGASNVQLASKVLEEVFPRMSSCKGAEHVTSLVFNDMCKCHPFQIVICANKMLHAFFMHLHGPHAVLMKESKVYFGRSVGPIRSSDARMGGHFMSLLRTFRLWNVFKCIVSSKVFQDCKGKKVQKEKIKNLVNSERFWDHIIVVLRAVFPLLKLLRLSDQSVPCMDRLCYFVRQTDKSISSSADDLNKIEEEFNEKGEHEGEYYHFVTMRKDGSNDYDDALASDSDNDSDEETDDNGPDSDAHCLGDAAVEDAAADIHEEMSLGDSLLKHWNKRRPDFMHDFSITAWMLCPLQEVMHDVKLGSRLSHRLAVDRIIDKIFWDDDDRGYLKTTFWQEFENFTSKTGEAYEARSCMWNDRNLALGKTWMWHKMHTLNSTKVLGRLACRVCSKLVGIGAAERSWGDVKHLKTGKRSGLSADHLKKQATLHGASCSTNASINRQTKDGVMSLFWEEDDLAQELGTAGTELDKAVAKVRMFKAHEEDWENPSKRNLVIEKRLQMKYGGLKWKDIDSLLDKTIYTSCSGNLRWQSRGRDKGHWIIATADADLETQPWTRECVWKSVVEFPHLNHGVKFLTLDSDLDNDDDDVE